MPVRLNSSGGGSVTLDVPSTTGTFTLNLPAANGSLGINGPAFRARLSSNQTVTNGVDTKVILNSKIFDTANCFDAVTNYRFTPNVAGYYQFNATQGASAGSSLSFNYIQIYKNGINDTVALYGPYQNVASYGALSALIYLNGTTDYVELFAQLAGTGTLQVVGGNTAVGTYLSGFLARAA